MRTEEFAALLATGAGPVERASVLRRYAIAAAWGLPGAVLLMATLLGLRAELGQEMRLPMFWVRLAYVAGLAVASVLLATRASIPGARLGGSAAALAAPVLVMWTLAVVALARAEPGGREHLLFGDTWTTCGFSIATLSVPMLIATLWAMKGLAPTRLRLAGAAAGALAGATGALAYTLHCPELAAPFLGFWYLLGILIPTTLGAALGPRVLRW
jgi:hypothetical protein